MSWTYGSDIKFEYEWSRNESRGYRDAAYTAYAIECEVIDCMPYKDNKFLTIHQNLLLQDPVKYTPTQTLAQ